MRTGCGGLSVLAPDLRLRLRLWAGRTGDDKPRRAGFGWPQQHNADTVTHNHEGDLAARSFELGGKGYCVPNKADRDPGLGERRARGSINWTFPWVQFWWALDWIGSATNRLLKPPNHAAISLAFEAVQRRELGIN